MAVGLLRDTDGRVLITRRGRDTHLGGLWEFPGGKCAPGEPAGTALDRELREELGIGVLDAVETLVIPHRYPDRRVELRVFRVDCWNDAVVAREGQPLRWVRPEALAEFAFPAASRAIVNAARLPETYLVSPAPPSPVQIADCVGRVEQGIIANAIRLLQIRAPGLDREAFLDYARRLLEVAARHRVETLVNAPEDWLDRLPPTGWHLTERRLRSLRARPSREGWLSASVHDREGLLRAMALPVDFVVVAPVRSTRTHPGARPLGFPAFTALRAEASCPMYALGGMTPENLPAVRALGAQGIAAIRGLLPEPRA
ncbi:Nudix family hydrolase [Thioalkalivibrio nitratireducens]|uniref:Nudix family hydrolase n=1 Tax=Thioalkalivibrio nitratireducens TaxID=186931 RepID=UPI003AACEA16